MRGRRRRPPKPRPGASRAVRRVCNLIALMVLIYALIARDVPVGFVGIAALLGNCPADGHVFHFTVGREFSKVIHACSITIFIGAIFLMLFY